MEKKIECGEFDKCLSKKLKREEFKKINKKKQKDSPKLIFVKDLISDCNYRWNSNSLLIFTSINNVTYIIYSDDENSIIVYNLVNNQRQCQIKKAHQQGIDIFRHCLDKKNKKDLIISCSKFYNIIKLWDFKNWQLLFNYRKENIKSLLLYNNFDNQFFILSNSLSENEDINVYNIKGTLIKKLDSSAGEIRNIDNYYDNDLSKNFVIVIYNNHISSFDFNINKFYRSYFNLEGYVYSLIIDKNKNKNKTKLIISCHTYIIIWDFHSGNMENKIFVCKRILRSVCPWNDEYYFTGGSTIKLVNINNKKITKLSKYLGLISSIKKYKHPQYDECLITKSFHNIKLWRIEK